MGTVIIVYREFNKPGVQSPHQHTSVVDALLVGSTTSLAYGIKWIAGEDGIE